MPKRSSSQEDPNVLAFNVVQDATTGPDRPKPKKKRKNQAAVELGRKGGLKGGRARAAALSPEERREIAKKAAARRWANKRSQEPE